MYSIQNYHIHYIVNVMYATFLDSVHWFL